MRLAFIERGNFGEAEYDPETGTYSWSYEGDDQEIIDRLSQLENGKVYTGMSTDDPNSGYEGEEIREIVVSEEYQYLPWDEQIEKLARSLRLHTDAEIEYVGE